MSNQTCSKCWNAPANPGRSWCQSCFLKSQNSSNNNQTNGYTGAGIIPVENYRNRNNRREIAVILIKNKRKFEDAGGDKDATDGNIEYTATRECKEETANTLRFSTSVCDWKNSAVHQYKAHKYVGFFVGINGPFFSKYFYSNLNMIKNQGCPHQWKETSGITRVYISDLTKAGIKTQRGDLAVNDANGNPIVILGRTKALIREALKSGVFQKMKFHKLYENQSYNGKNGQKFLNGTHCYYT